MDLFNFGRQQLQDGSLNGMLEQVGIDDVGSFVDQFRGEAHSGASSGGSGSSGDMIQGAISAYKAFSGGKGSGGGGGGNLLDSIGSTYQNAQKMHAMYKQFDKNGDGKITADDVEILLKELGLGQVSPYFAKAIFASVDQNHNGSLDFTDMMALLAMLNKLSGQFGGLPQN